MTQHVSIADFTRLDTHRPAHAVRRTGVREARAQVAPSHTGNWRHWHMEVDAEDIVWLGLDVADASTNLLSAQVLEELDAVLEALSHASPSGVVISSRKANGFIAGADVHEFTHLREIDDALPLIQRGQQVFNRLADLECPTVAMIHGFCLGGGLELALACRYRVAADDADGRLGLPEVKLGIHPGFGGSVRATALLGAPAAMELMLTARILMPYLLEAVELESEGVPAAQIDAAAVAFGMPMGPVELADSVGLDICLSVTEILAGELPVVVPQRLKQLVAMGHLGVKTGAGFYDYKRGKPVISRQEADIAQRTLTDRLMLRMVNEAMACLREGVVADADLLDAGMVFGTGFAPFRGGPMHYSGVIGTPNIVEKLHVLAERSGKRFTPDPGWQG